MNNKGFTLVELIAIIALLGLIIGIGIPSIMNVNKSSKIKLLNTKIKNIEASAVVYAQEDENRIKFTKDDVDACLNTYCKDKTGTIITNCYCYKDGINTTITVQDLITNKKLNVDDESNQTIINPTNEEKTLNNCRIQIYKKYGKIYAVYLDKNNNETECWE